ncbi:hypothetical protein B0H14DRAFT_2750474 [Mycena olivaceomarginata]|nr:hypothetical protein B0H14DRAFT_2750474 [Mycena olivaceomarginata]
MCALSAFPLDDDIVAHIMTFCSTFGSLHSATLVCHTFHRVFSAHPKSITYAVAYNIVGPALPQALRLLRYPYPNDKAGTAIDPIILATNCPEEHDTASLITAKEKILLQLDSELVEALENLYSSLFKDRNSQTSVLNWEESHRFRRSMYRIMLYCELFNGSRWNLDEIDILDEEIFNRIWSQRTAVLDTYPLDEILEIYSSVHFLRGMIEKLMVNELMQTEDEDLYLEILLSAGPDGVWEAWEASDYNVLAQYLGFGDDMLVADNKLFSGYFLHTLKGVWANRQFSEDDGRTLAPAGRAAQHNPSQWILDSVNGGEE